MNNQNTKLEHALSYIKQGWSVIPIGSDKKPLIPWKQYQTERASGEQIQTWFTRFPNMNIGIVTGKISGIVVVDVEKDGSIQGLPPTVCTRTGGGGWHFYYAYPGYEVPNFGRIKELTDVRGDGGYVVVPPSLHASGTEYKWSIKPENSEMAEIPDWLVEAIQEKDAGNVEHKDWKTKISTGAPVGTRNTTATEIAGKLIHDLSPEMRETAGWDALFSWNKKNEVPLPEKELRQTFESILAKHKKTGTDEDNDTKKTSQATQLIQLIEADDKITLFHDQYQETYVRLPMQGHSEIWKCRSKQFKQWLSKTYWDKNTKAPNSDAINTALTTIEAKARFEGHEYKLNNRVALLDGILWYDLSDTHWQAVKITENGWNVSQEPPILFKRYAHQQTQLIPESGGDILSLFKYINVTNESHKILLIAFIVSAFIPEFPHPIPNIYGDQGSAKSTLSRVLRKLIDPSQIETDSFPKNNEELIQKVNHSWFIPFDNVSVIHDTTSDLLCRVVTGSGYSKRELYSDDEDVIYNVQRIVSLNGINNASTRPDLLERSILFNLKRISEEDRREENELMKQFEAERPQILGAILDTVSLAMKIKPTIRLTRYPRMADFASWGCAVAVALGYTQKDFLDAYNENITGQNQEVINENTEASLIVDFMEDKLSWTGKASELLNELRQIATIQILPEKSLPKAPNALTRKINILKTNLEQAGILITQEKKGRTITLEKISENNVGNIPENNGTDENDILSLFLEADTVVETEFSDDIET